MAEKKTEILNNLQQQSVEEIWTAFKTALHSGISQFIPIKKIGPKKSLPWITQEIKKTDQKTRQSVPKAEKRKTKGQTSPQTGKAPGPK